MAERKFDLVCMGRAAVDLYGEQIGARLEDVTSFAKYLGGSPANTGVGASRLGLKVAMLTRVGDEHNGRFLRETLAAEGLDVSHVKTDPEKLTALVFLGIKDRQTFPLIFYRHDCADMAISEEDFDARFLGSAKALLVSGTHFSRDRISATCFEAIEIARKENVRIVFDIDYRPVLWGLTSPGMGEQRFVSSKAVTERLREIVPHCDLIIGTEEEFHIAGGSEDTDTALREIRSISKATLVVKRGPMGCSVFSGSSSFDGQGFPVEVFNVLGAGDGFAGGFLSGWLKDLPLEECARRANACGAIVVSRHGCAPAMASKEELELFLSRKDWPFRLRESSLLNEVHRKTTNRRKWPEVLALAFDHRKQLEALGPPEMIRKFKRLIAQGLRRNVSPATGAIVDDRYGDDALYELTGSGMWLGRPVEVPGSMPLQFEAGDNIAAELRTWPAEHVVKCLFHFDRNDFQKVLQLQEACIATGHELLLEILPRDLPRALKDCYAAGIRPDWWKLPPPPAESDWQEISETIGKNDPYCRGVILLGMEASEEALERGFALAARHPACKGFAVGRTIFMDAARRWFAGQCTDEEAIQEVSRNYSKLVQILAKREADMQRIGFIGIGLMGHGMAKNLVKKGHPLCFLVNRNRSNIADLLELKAKEAKTPAEVISRSDVVFLCVTGSPQVEANVYGADGLLGAANKGQIVIDCSTAMPESTDRIRADFEKKGVRYVDAPLARTPVQAEEGKLNCMVGADEKTFAEVKPVLEKFCENIFHVGGPGTGHRFKLINNFMALGYSAIACEAFTVCAKLGIDLDVFYKIVSAGGANSPMFQMIVPKAIQGDFTGLLFTLANGKKDIGYYQQMVGAAPGAGPAFGPMGAALYQVLVQANALGLGEKFVPSLIEAYEKVNQIQVVKH